MDSSIAAAIDSTRRHALATGVFFITAAVAGVIGLLLYSPLLNQTDYVLGAGADTRILLGALFEVIVVVSVIGTGVALYPVVKKENESVALAYVCGRLLEATVIAVGIISVLAVVTLRQDGVADADSLAPIAGSLVAIHDWTFLLGPGLIIGVNSFLLAYLMYRSALVPRFIAVLGLVGGPVILASSIAILFGAYEQVSTWGFLSALLVIAWEMSLAVWLIVDGFKTPQSATDGAVSEVMPREALLV